MKRKSKDIQLLQNLQLQNGKFKTEGLKEFKKLYKSNAEKVFWFIDLMDRRYKGITLKSIKPVREGMVVYYTLPHNKETFQFLWHINKIPSQVARELIGYEIEQHWKDIIRVRINDEI